MKMIGKLIKIFSLVLLLTAFLTWFFYAHEKLPKPIRAATAFIETPVAMASGISYYLKPGIAVYESPIAIIISNFTASVVLVLVGYKALGSFLNLSFNCTKR